MSAKMKVAIFMILVWIAERFTDMSDFLLDEAGKLMPEANEFYEEHTGMPISDGIEFIGKEVR